MIICFSTHKGGTGKTTSSINLASGLARAGKKTLLVDLDPQGHSSLGLGVEIGYDEPNIADVLTDHGQSLEKILRLTEIPNLAIAPSNLRLASVAESLYAKFKREERLEQNLKPLKDSYEWIVIDCPPALGVLTANAANASDAVIIPCQMGARALDGLGDLLNLVHLLKGESFKNWWILLTMIDPRKTVTLDIFQQILDPYQERILKTRIAVSESLNQAQMAKQDIFTFDPKSKGAQNYEVLTNELLDIYP